MMKTAATIAALLVSVVPAWAAPPTYSLTPLGLVSTPQICEGHQTPEGVDINAAGQVTGTYCLQNGTQSEIRGFLWTPQHGMVDLGLPPGVTDPTTAVYPFSINARGQIAGEVRNSSLDEAFVWDRGSFNLIAPNAQAFAINDPGQGTGNLANHAFLFSHGVLRDLGLGAAGATASRGFAINNLGHIAGEAYIPVPAPAYYSVVPILWSGAAWQVLGKPPLSGDYTLPGSINNFDEIVGVSYSSNTPVEHAFLWKGRSVHRVALLAGPVLRGQLDHDPLHGQVRIGGGVLNARGEILTGGIYTGGQYDGRFEVFIATPNQGVAAR
jgi:hypothetical protein